MYIYCSGPLSHSDPEVEKQRAVDIIKAGAEVYKRGHVPIVPHFSIFTHTHIDLEYRDWLSIDLKWIEKCDALLYLNKNGDRSVGCFAEIGFAHERGMAIYRSLDQIPNLVSGDPEEINIGDGRL
jgi:hypothetical protein